MEATLELYESRTEDRFSSDELLKQLEPVFGSPAQRVFSGDRNDRLFEWHVQGKEITKAVEFLIESGYKRIAYIAGLPSIPTTRQREQGYRDAHERYNLELDDSLIKYGDSKYESGRILCGELLDEKSPPDAIFAGNNLMTLGALETIHKKGLKIPGDIAVIGFDDAPVARHTVPTLTTIRQPVEELATVATRLLLTGAAGIDPVLPTELVIRESA